MPISIEEDGGIKVTSQDGTEIHIPESYVRERNAYLFEKYGEDVQNASRLQPGEMPNQYRERLASLYPREDQRAYLDGMMAVAEAGTFGMYALQSYTLGEPLVPEVTSMYPLSQNQELIGKGVVLDIPLKMSREATNKLIISCNSAAYHVKKTGDELVNKERQHLRRALSGEINLEDLPFTSKIKIGLVLKQLELGKGLLGKELAQQLLEEQVNQLVNHDLLDLFTPEVSKGFHKIALSCANPIDVIQLYTNLTFLSLATDNMDVFLWNYTDFSRVYDRVIKQTRKDWKD